VPRFTESRIQQLCAEAITVETQEDVERVMRELRLALNEHIRLAKDSLTAQASVIALTNSVSAR
jgi:hypothetical protein